MYSYQTQITPSSPAPQEQNQECNDWRSKAIKDCIEVIMEQNLYLVRRDYPAWEKCYDKRDREHCMFSDPEMSMYGELTNAYISGQVPEKYNLTSNERIENAAKLGQFTRKDAENHCSENPVIYVPTR